MVSGDTLGGIAAKYPKKERGGRGDRGREGERERGTRDEGVSICGIW